MFACVHVADSRVSCLEALMVLGRGFTPLVEQTSSDTVVLDIAGCERLFGPPRRIGQEIARRASRSELKASVAVAGNPDVAVCAALGVDGFSFISQGSEAVALAGLPVGLLRVVARMPARLLVRAANKDAGDFVGVGKAGAVGSDVSVAEADDDLLRRIDEILGTLDLWGIRTFGELAVLPEAGLSERLGEVGLRLRRLARGECHRPLLLERSESQFQKAIELDDPVELLEPLSFILSGLFESLCIELKNQALAASEIGLRMRLEDRSVYERVIRLPFPMRSSKVFVRLLGLEIESHPPESAIVAVAVTAEPVEPRSLQSGLFQPLAPEPEKLELTLIRLMKLVGPENVGSPEILDTHRPDAFRVRRFSLKRLRKQKAGGRIRQFGSSIMNLKALVSKASVSSKTPVASRVSAPDWQFLNESDRSSNVSPGYEGGELQARPMLQWQEVSSRELRSVGDQSVSGETECRLGFRVFRPPLQADVDYQFGRPARIRAQSEMQSRVLRGRVVEAAGPWRTSGDWWRADGWVRDEWDVAIAETGVLYRIYRDLRSGGWFVEGVYD